MVYPTRHLLLAFGGSLRGSEQWSQTLRLTNPNPIGDQAGTEALCTAIRGVLSTYWTTGVSGQGAVLEFVKLNEIRPDGKYAQAYTVRQDLSPTVNPTSPSVHANQIALVATLETGVTRGYASRGRMFFPIPVGQVSSADGLISTTLQDQMAGVVKDLLDGINALSGGPRVCIFSPVGEGAFRPVTAVSVGRVLDTMQSRRAQLKEARSTVALATVP